MVAQGFSRGDPFSGQLKHFMAESVVDAVSQGKQVDAIRSFIVNNGTHLVERVPAYGLVQKSQTTRDLENVVRTLFRDPKKATFKEKKDAAGKMLDMEITVGKKKYSLMKMFKNADFNFLELEQEDFDRYQRMLITSAVYKPVVTTAAGFARREEAYLVPRYPGQEYADYVQRIRSIRLQEKEAINVYTGSGYDVISNLLRKDLDGMYKTAANPSVESARLPDLRPAVEIAKEVLQHTAIAVHGLNSLPGYIPPPTALTDDPMTQFVFRGETGKCPDWVIQQRIKAATHQDVMIEGGFLSTADKKPAEVFFAPSSKGGILFEASMGRDVRAFSAFPNEREVLMPPTQILWKGWTKIARLPGPPGFLTEDVVLFMAVPIRSPREIPVKLEELCY
jgi:hypothetical protein